MDANAAAIDCIQNSLFIDVTDNDVSQPQNMVTVPPRTRQAELSDYVAPATACAIQIGCVLTIHDAGGGIAEPVQTLRPANGVDNPIVRRA